MTAITLPTSGVGWVIFGTVVVIVVLALAYLHIRDESVRSIRLGIFLERERHERDGDQGDD